MSRGSTVRTSVLAMLCALSAFTVPACGATKESEYTQLQDQLAPSPFARTSNQERAGRTLVDARSLSLDELVQRADRILRGRVRRIEEKTVSLTEGGEKAEALVRDVTITVEDGIKNAVTGKDIVIRQLVSVSAPLSENDEVLWFLARDSTLGLTQPLGVYSGDFRIQGTGVTKVVNNLRGNTGLWDGSLWTGDGFNRSRVLDTAAKIMALPAARVNTIDRAASVNPDNRDIPLDLLIAATKSRVTP
jgi:hypothetical protein